MHTVFRLRRALNGSPGLSGVEQSRTTTRGSLSRNDWGAERRNSFSYAFMSERREGVDQLAEIYLPSSVIILGSVRFMTLSLSTMTFVTFFTEGMS